MHEIPLPCPRSAAKPQQIRAYDNRDSRLELVRLLRHLSPPRRLAFLAWACQQATLPNTLVRPEPERATVRLAELAQRDDRADDQLTLEIVFDLCHLSLHYALDLDAVVARLVALARNPRNRGD